METHRVQKLLSNYGFCSRRKAEELIIAGKVQVNGKVVKIGDQATEADKITVDGKPVFVQKKLYIIFHKPTGCATALEDKFQRTIMHYIKLRERVFPIGRLDFNTSGLLLLTNDGDFANSIMHPRYEVKKTYLVETKEPIEQSDLGKIEHGVKLDDGMTSPAKTKQTAPNKAEIVIHEGKNRIIRRMMGFLGYHVLSLQRIRIGKLELGNLQPGKYRQMTEDEKKLIFK